MQAVLDSKTSSRCFLRSYLLGAAFTPQGMQSLGLAYAIEPGLAAIYSDQNELLRARARYIRHFNTHPFCAPFLLGLFLNLEQLIAQGLLQEEALPGIKDTAGYTLSAIGDSVFSGTLIPFWALAFACLMLQNLLWAALFFTGCLFVGFHVFRLLSFSFALRHGLHALEYLKDFDIINWGERLKYCNAVLLALLLGLTESLSHNTIVWAAFCVALPVIGYFLVLKTNLPRAIPLCAVIALYWLLAT